MSAPCIFISYRRDDAPGSAQMILRRLQSWAGGIEVFMDTDSIRVGDRWMTEIDEALHRSTILIVVIGPHWLTLKDKYEKRRIDNENDWVRVEVKTALEEGKHVIPVLVGKTAQPEKEALPQDLQDLVGRQWLDLTGQNWEHGFGVLSLRLRELGVVVSDPRVSYPAATVTREASRPLDKARLANITAELPGWSVTKTEITWLQSMRTELHRLFEFDNFPQAMQFMYEASRFIHEGEHHPRWENLWCSVRVWLSTWDTDHAPSELDVELARRLNAFFDDFKARAKKQAGAAFTPPAPTLQA